MVVHSSFSRSILEDMANEIGRKEDGSLAKKGDSSLKKAAKKTALKKSPGKKTALKHAEKHAEKHAAKKHAKKTAKHVADEREAGLKIASVKGDKALRKAFHHMQRASVVISLVDKAAGGDLADFLAKGIELFAVAVRVGGKHGSSDAALGVLRAAEHLGMAGLYAARVDYRADVEAPADEKATKRLKKLKDRVGEISVAQEGYWMRVRSMALELLRRAEASGDDPHMQWELSAAADGLCDALEAAGA
jgi:hypothetical protein